MSDNQIGGALFAKSQDIDTVVQAAQAPTPVEAPEVIASEPESAPEPVQEKAPEPEGFQARNFRELKEIARRERAEKEALAKEMEKIRAMLVEQQNHQQNGKQTEYTYEPEELDLGNDELAEGKHIKKLSASQKKIFAEQQKEAQKLRAEVEAMRIERELERELPDFYNVVTKDNVESLAMMDPDLSAIIANYPDLKKAAKATYSAIVKNGINKMHDYDVQKELIKQNMAKPKTNMASSPSSTNSPMSRATDNYTGDLTDEMKKMFYAEMKRNQQGR